MNVLFLNRVYPPTDGATGQLLAELAPELVQAGWQVTVVTSRAAGHSARSEMANGVRVERVGGLPFTRASHWKRALGYLALYPALLWRAWRLPRADVVVTLTDPPLHLLLGPILKWTKGSRLIHWAQDIYPELAEELEVLPRGGWLAGICRWLSTWALKKHDRILAVGDCMKRRLLERGVSASAIRVVPNWAPVAPVFPVAPSENIFRREHQLENCFVVMYSGNLGLAHSFEAIIDAAKELQPKRPDILFLFVGAGPRLNWVKEQAETWKLANVRFLPPQPLDKLAQSLGAADVHLASMRENLCGLVVPSKVYGILAAARPCLFLGPKVSEVAQVIAQHQCGEVMDAPNGAKLAASLIGWANQPERLEAAGRRAQQWTQEAGLSQAVRRFEENLGQVCDSSVSNPFQAREAGREIPSLSSEDFLLQQMPSNTQK